MASIYVARHSLALWGETGCIGAVELTADEQDAIAQQLLKHAADRRKNGDHSGADDSGEWIPHAIPQIPNPPKRAE